MALLRATSPGERRRHRDQRDRAHDGDELPAERPRVDLPLAARDHRDAEHEQDVRDDRAGERASHDAGQRVRDREQGDDQLRCIPEARVQEATDAGAGVLRGVLGRLADQPGEWDERERREDEQRRLVEVEHEARQDCGGREDERSPEEPARHVASVDGR